MNKNFYLRLGATNIKKNGIFYIPYLITGILTVSMFYIMASIAMNDNLPGGMAVSLVLTLGIIVIGIFGTLFLFYTNNFLIKRRKKELGLYNVLGMEKKHIARVLFHETAISAAISIVGGIVIGAAMSKLLFWTLLKMTKLDTNMEFQFKIIPAIITVVVFLAVYLLILLYNRIQIKKAKPVDMMHSANVGEKEPKVKWVLVVIGIITLGLGYYMAAASQDTITAIILFFLAVILVIIGTYCLFTAGSIAVLKVLKNNKNYYYRKNHFVSVSGMIYRMKQNAKGLANICILSTMVLVTVSTTVGLYVGIDDMINNLYPNDVEFVMKNSGAQTQNMLEQTIRQTAEYNKAGITKYRAYESLDVAVGIKENGDLYTDVDDRNISNSCQLTFITASDYNSILDTDIRLDKNKVAIRKVYGEFPTNFKLFGENYKVVEERNDKSIGGNSSIMLQNAHTIIVDSEDTLHKIYQEQLKAYGDQASPITFTAGFNIGGKDPEILQEKMVTQVFDNCRKNMKYDSLMANINSDKKAEFIQFTGGFLFLGIFLGVLFLIFTVIIIYYKQIIEGYEDRDRFEIMKKVGMDKQLIKGSIKNQVLSMFMLPIVVAAIHMAFAFPMIKLIMRAFALTNVSLLSMCTLATIAIFLVIYIIVYRLTARTYFNIVKG